MADTHTTLILNTLRACTAERLQKAVEGLVSGAYTITLVSQSEAEIRGFVVNGDGTEYLTIIADRPYCGCRDFAYRSVICKHMVALSLSVLRNPRLEPIAIEDDIPAAQSLSSTPVLDEARTLTVEEMGRYNLTLCRARKGFGSRQSA